MKEILLIYISCIITFSLSAQKIENVRFEQSGKMISIYYDLVANKGGQTFDIKVYYSIDGAKTWIGPLAFVSGNAGKDQSAGSGKKISWDVLSECDRLIGNVMFEVRATPGVGLPVGTTSGGGASGTFTDSRDGETYHYVTIGRQVWMADNLAYLPSVSSSSQGSGTEPFYYVCDYSGSSVSAAKATDNYKTYGVLYNWPAAMNGAASRDANPSGLKGVCPNGWHLPSDSEWTELTDYIGGASVDGGKLKEAGFKHWASPNKGANNETGFTALPGGCRGRSGAFYGIGYYGRWWGSAEASTDSAWGRGVVYDFSNVYRYYYYKNYGFSVRCLRDPVK